MLDFNAPRSGNKKFGLLLSVLAVILIVAALGLALKPEIFSLRSSRIVGAVSISPQDAVLGGAEWRVVSQWQGSGPFQEEGSFYLVEFKPIPGWEIPAPVVLRKGVAESKVEGIYREAAFSEQILFSLAGATTMGHRLVPELVEFYLRHIGANEVRRVPGLVAGELTLQGIFYSTQEIKTITVEGTGTDSGFSRLRSGDCDIAMASRRASLATEGAWATGILQPENEFPVALDAVALVVHQGNPIHTTGLSLDQIRQIFSGEISNWGQLGGDARPMSIFIPAKSLGTRVFFEKYFMNGTAFTPAAREMETLTQLVDQVDQDPWAIGFCSQGFIVQGREVPLQVSAATPPVLPSPRTIKDGTYPAVRELYLYLPSDSKNIYAHDFISVCGSAAGQDVVRRFGFMRRDDQQLSQSALLPALRSNSTATPSVPEQAVVQPELLLPVVGQAPGPDAPGRVDGDEILMDNATEPETRDDAPRPGSVAAIFPRSTDIPEDLPVLPQVDGEIVPVALRHKVYGAWRDAVLGAEHLPQVFRFDLASSTPNAQARDDLDQVVKIVQSSEQAGKQLIVVGFSDSYGNYARNQEISLQRAEVLAAALREQGARVALVLGAGEEQPLVSNDKRVGREQNRRVELWLK